MAWPTFVPTLKPWQSFSRPFKPWRKFVDEMPDAFDEEARERYLPEAVCIESYLTELRQSAENVPTDFDADRSTLVRALWAQRQRLLTVLLRDDDCREVITDHAFQHIGVTNQNLRAMMKLSDLRWQEASAPGTAAAQIIEHLQQHFVSPRAMASLVQSARDSPTQLTWLVHAEQELAALAPLHNSVVDAYAGLAALYAAQFNLRHGPGLSFRLFVEAGITGIQLACDSFTPLDDGGFLKNINWWIRNRILKYLLSCWDMSVSEIDEIARARKARKSLPREDQWDMEKISDAAGIPADRCKVLLRKRPKMANLPVQYEGLYTLFQDASSQSTDV